MSFRPSAQCQSVLPLHRKVRVGFPIQRKPLMYSGLLTSETESTRTLEPLRTEFFPEPASPLRQAQACATLSNFKAPGPALAPNNVITARIHPIFYIS